MKNQLEPVDDPTQILETLRSTQLLGVVSLLYGMLLHADAPSRGDTLPPSLPPHTVAVATISFLLLNHIAELDVNLLQVCACVCACLRACVCLCMCMDGEPC